jgi:eukaryotic-like serine/threonine-protein kinase
MEELPATHELALFMIALAFSRVEAQAGSCRIAKKKSRQYAVYCSALPLTGERKPQVLVQQGSEGNLSPDGHWLAYISTESGTPEVYVVAFGGGQGKWQVSSSGGALPRWSTDGKKLFYLDLTYSLLAVPVTEGGGALQFGAATTVVGNWSAPQVFYDLAPDGKKILLERVPQQVSQSVSVISNFTTELKK